MPCAAETCIGLDVGGTWVRAARITRDGRIAARTVEPVAADRQGFAAQLLRLIADMADATTRAVGIGIPGRVDGQGGAILSAGFIDAAGLDLPGLILRETSLPARVANDAMMALVAEDHARYLADPGTDGLIAMLTVGTGIGGAIVLGGAPWHGGGIAGQFGHMVVAADGPVCKCGRVGCVETFSSGTALRRLMAEAGLPKSASVKDLFAAEQAGDSGAAAILTAWAAPFARAIDTLVAVLDPRRVIVGGGLGHDMVRALDRTRDDSTWFSRPVEPARLGDDAGVIGAGLSGFALLEDAP